MFLFLLGICSVFVVLNVLILSIKKRYEKDFNISSNIFFNIYPCISMWGHQFQGIVSRWMY